MKSLRTIWYYTERPLMCIIVILLLMLAILTGAAATEELNAEGRRMFQVLHKQQGYPMPIAYPVYHLGPTGDMPASCAQYVACYANGHVYILAPMLFTNERERLTSLLHENVHHLQWEKKGSAMNCEENYYREKEAHKAHQAFLAENYGQHVRSHIKPCPKPK